MAIKLQVVRADLTFEAGYPEPAFSMLQDTAPLLGLLFRRLAPYGLRLADVRVERGAGNVGDHQILLDLFDYAMTVRIRVERIEVTIASLPRELVERYEGAILEVVKAVADCHPALSFRAFAIALGLHARLDGQPAREYLARFVATAPEGLGPSTGNGAVFYFGSEEERLLASVTLDVSAVVPDAVYARIHGVWDANKLSADSLPAIARNFVDRTLNSLGLQLPG